MNLRNLLHHLTARRPGLLETKPRLGLLCLQEAARHVARETLRLRGTLALAGINNASFIAGPFKESFLRPTVAQLATIVFSDLSGLDDLTETKSWESIRVLGAWLKNGVGGQIQPLLPVPLPALREEAKRFIGSPTSTAPPMYFADAQGAVALWPPFDQSLGFDTLTLELAVCPAQQEYESLPLPPEAEEAVVEEAIGRIYAYGGPGQNDNLAMSHRASAEHKIATLRVTDAIGSSGRPIYSRSQFGFQLRR